MRWATGREGERLEFQQLLWRARQGDHAARTQLYVDYGRRFRRIIGRRLRTQRLAWATTPHDVFDTVVLRVWEEDALATLPDEPAFLKYVSRAVNHEIQDLRRTLTAYRRDYRRLEPLPEAESGPVTELADPARQASASEELESVRSRLSPLDREVLEMWLAEFPWTEIASQAGSKVEAIRKRFYRALAALRANVDSHRQRRD